MHALPDELIHGSHEAVRMAERIARRFVDAQDAEGDTVQGLVARLNWAIAALESVDGDPRSGSTR